MGSRSLVFVRIVLRALPAALFWILVSVQFSNANACIQYYHPPCQPYSLQPIMALEGLGLWIGSMVLGTVIDALWRFFRHPLPPDELSVDQWERSMRRRVNFMPILRVFLPSLLPPFDR